MEDSLVYRASSRPASQGSIVRLKQANISEKEPAMSYQVSTFLPQWVREGGSGERVGA